VTVNVGEGAGVSLANVNRDSKSNDDTTEPGSVYDTDRISDNAVESTKIADGSVLEQKLADLAVATAKLQNNAVINGKLDDLSVSKTKIQDDAISTPKLVAGAVTAAKIEADTITASQIAAGTITTLELAADSVTAAEIAAGSIDAQKISTLDLDADQISINDPGSTTQLVFEIPNTGDIQIRPENANISRLGTGFDPFSEAIIQDIFPETDNTGSIGNTSFAHSEIWAHDFINAQTDTSIISGNPADGGDPLATLGKNPEPPEDMKVRDDSGDVKGLAIGTLAQYAYELCSAQQRRIDDLESRLSKLEAQQ